MAFGICQEKSTQGVRTDTIDLSLGLGQTVCMTTQEMLSEIEAVKRRIAMLPEGSTLTGELTVALVLLYDAYVMATEGRKVA